VFGCMKKILFLYVFIAIFSSSYASAQTVETPIQITPFTAKVSTPLVAQNNSKIVDKIGLSFDIPAGWNTYWRSAGATGLPTELFINQKENVKKIQIFWPFPELKDEIYGLNYVYSHSFTLPLYVERIDPKEPASFSATLFYGACETICIPASHDFELKLSDNIRENPLGHDAWKVAFNQSSNTSPFCDIFKEAKIEQLGENKYSLKNLSASSTILVELLHNLNDIVALSDIKPQKIEGEDDVAWMINLQGENSNLKQALRVTAKSGSYQSEALIPLQAMTNIGLHDICKISVAAG